MIYKLKTDSEIAVSSVVPVQLHYTCTTSEQSTVRLTNCLAPTNPRLLVDLGFPVFPKKPILYSICIQLKSHSIIHLPNKEETSILPRSAVVCGLISVSRFKTNEIEFFTLATLDGRTHMLQNSLALETILAKHVS